MKVSSKAAMDEVILKTSEGARIHINPTWVVYYPKHARTGVKVTWREFDKLMRQHQFVKNDSPKNGD
jgi:hypothetical protein